VGRHVHDGPGHLPAAAETLRIPADHAIGYALLFGRPDVQYHRPVKRGPATVNILE
jgi:hypothetical protein